MDNKSRYIASLKADLNRRRLIQSKSQSEWFRECEKLRSQVEKLSMECGILGVALESVVAENDNLNRIVNRCKDIVNCTEYAGTKYSKIKKILTTEEE